MSIEKLIIEAPILCGATHAKKHQVMAKLAWNAEKQKQHFQREPGESAYNRIAFLFDWECTDIQKRNYCRGLVTLCVHAHYLYEHKDEKEAEAVQRLTVALNAESFLYPDVNQILTVETAARGFWY